MAPTRHNFFPPPPFHMRNWFLLFFFLPCQSPRKAKDDSLALFHFRVLLSRRRKLNLLPEVREINMCLKLAYLREATVCKFLWKKIWQFIPLLGVRRDVNSAIFFTGNWSFSFPPQKKNRETTPIKSGRKNPSSAAAFREDKINNLFPSSFSSFSWTTPLPLRPICGKWCVAAGGLFVSSSCLRWNLGRSVLGRPGNPWMDLISPSLPSLAGCVVVFCGLGFCGERGGRVQHEIFFWGIKEGGRKVSIMEASFLHPPPSFLPAA